MPPCVCFLGITPLRGTTKACAMVFAAEGDEVPKANDVTHVATIEKKDVVFMLILFVVALLLRRCWALSIGGEEKDAAELYMALVA